MSEDKTSIGPVTKGTLADFNKQKQRKPDGKLETAEEVIIRLMSKEQRSARASAQG